MFLINQLQKAVQLICSVFVLFQVMAHHLLHINNNLCNIIKYNIKYMASESLKMNPGKVNLSIHLSVLMQTDAHKLNMSKYRLS